MGKKTTNSRVVIRDDILNGQVRSRSGTKDWTTKQRAVQQRGQTFPEEAPRTDPSSGTHCTGPSVNGETILAPRRPTRSQGRPVARPSDHKEASEEPPKLCQFYLRTGTCGYGDGCRHIHPPDVQPPKLSFLGYPLREGAERCRFYLRNGFCGFGATCCFDHPPPPRPTGQILNPGVLGPTLNPRPSFSESIYFSPMPSSSWYGAVLPPVSYAAFMARQSLPFAAGGYPQYPYEYPPMAMHLAEGWPQSSYFIGSPSLGPPGLSTSEDPSELHEDVFKSEEDVFKSEEDDHSDTSGQIDRCWSN